MSGAGEVATLSTNRYSRLGEAVLLVLKKQEMLTESNTCCKERLESEHVWWAGDGVWV